MSDVGGGASRTTDVAAGTSSATDVSLREYLGQMIVESRRECRDNITHLEQKFDTAMTGIDKRFDGVNEFRNALSDLSSLMATKDNMSRVEEKFVGQVTTLNQRVSGLEKRIDLRDGQEAGSRLTKSGIYAALAVAVAALGAFVVLANYLTGQ
jgi:hypothetical protein